MRKWKWRNEEKFDRYSKPNPTRDRARTSPILSPALMVVVVGGGGQTIIIIRGGPPNKGHVGARNFEVN